MNEKDFVKIESILNRKGDQLPFGLFSPQSDGKLTWNCGLDAENKIVSVFCFNAEECKDKKVAFLEDMKQAVYMRDELLASGWQILEPPKIVIKYEDGTEKDLSRQQKRYLSKTVTKMKKNNPFEDKDKK